MCIWFWRLLSERRVPSGTFHNDFLNVAESETLEAIAQFDFTARSQRELSFKKGDILTLYTQVSSDWWKGTKDGRDGLIPDKYILLRIRLAFGHLF